MPTCALKKFAQFKKGMTNESISQSIFENLIIKQGLEGEVCKIC